MTGQGHRENTTMNRTPLTLGALLLLSMVALPAQAGPVEDLGDRVFDVTDCFVFGPCNTDPDDRDGDHVPDGVEPAVCLNEDPTTGADGSCDPAGTDYLPPSP